MTTETIDRKLSDHVIIANIRADAFTSRLWRSCTTEQKRAVLRELDGDFWHVEEVLENVLADGVAADAR